MAVNPYYNKPNQEGLFQHFKTIAESTSLPLMVYNIKGRTAVNIETETLLKLSDIENIKMIKEASGDLDQQTDVISKMPSDFSVLSGDDPNTLAFIALGGDGVVSVASNIIPKTMRTYIHFCLNENFEEARKIFYTIYPLLKTLMTIDTNPLGIKELMAQMGYCEPVFRLPLVRLSEEKQTEIKKLIETVKSLENE